MDKLKSLESDLLKDVSYLAEKIGIRFAGTKNDNLAAEYINKRFSEIGLNTETMKYQIMGWKLVDEPLLETTNNSSKINIKCAPYIYSSSTPNNGVTGILKYWGKAQAFDLHKFRLFEREKFKFDKYSVIDTHNRIVAHIVSRDFPCNAAASPWGTQKLPYTLPTVMIGEQDGRRLQALIQEQKAIKIFLRYKTEFNPFAESYNIIGELKGKDSKYSSEKIFILAHYDTKYNSPGAVDNASGVACLISLANHFTNNRLKRSIVFGAYGCEEIGLLGSKYHFEELQARNAINNIKFVLDLDMLACNEPNWIHATSDFLAQESTRRAVREIEIEKKYGFFEIVTPPWSGDHDAFVDHNIACVFFTWKGYKYPYTHLPEDTIDKTNKVVLFDSLKLACSIIENVDRML